MSVHVPLTEQGVVVSIQEETLACLVQVLCRQQGHEVQPFSPCTGMQLYDTATPGVPVAAEVMAVAQR